MHAYAGFGRGDYFDEYEFEAGIINVLFRRVNLNIGFAYPGYYFDLTAGVGIVFLIILGNEFRKQFPCFQLL